MDNYHRQAYDHHPMANTEMNSIRNILGWSIFVIAILAMLAAATALWMRMLKVI
jgi:hypothetical protein